MKREKNIRRAPSAETRVKRACQEFNIRNQIQDEKHQLKAALLDNYDSDYDYRCNEDAISDCSVLR